LAILESEAGLTGVGLEAVRWEVGAGVAAYLRSDSTYVKVPALPAAERLSKMLAKRAKTGRFETPKPHSDSELASIWVSGSGPKRSDFREVHEGIDLILDEFGEGGSLRIGMYQARSRSLQSALSVLSRNQGLAAQFGRPPEAKLLEDLTVLLAREPKKDMQVPGWDITFGELLLAAMIADLEHLGESGHVACGLYFKTPNGSANFLQALANRAPTASGASSGDHLPARRESEP
jgi:hypothetical protein